ncbi:hypothetical protein [Kitasatospora sp. NRRL B-11411]|uniref:hypothetical protein n=1 Tax=Kitasatospora sp. NRRL B-11411 TaxID=1463822 RepID=UPI000ABF69F0|nr:hypothetical protein [Kitasatospora sp. NRRL B-11411]
MSTTGAAAPDDIAVRTALRRAPYLSGRDLADRWFTGRPDGLRPSSGEDFPIAST